MYLLNIIIAILSLVETAFSQNSSIPRTANGAVAPPGGSQNPTFSPAISPPIPTVTSTTGASPTTTSPNSTITSPTVASPTATSPIPTVTSTTVTLPTISSSIPTVTSTTVTSPTMTSPIPTVVSTTVISPTASSTIPTVTSTTVPSPTTSSPVPTVISATLTSPTIYSPIPTVTSTTATLPTKSSPIPTVTSTKVTSPTATSPNVTSTTFSSTLTSTTATSTTTQAPISTPAQQVPQKRKIKVGVAAEQNVIPTFVGWAQLGGAIPLAIERLNQNGITNDFEFELMVNYTDCDRSASVGVIVDFVKTKNVDLVIAPPCPPSGETLSLILSFYDIMNFGYGFLVSSEFSLVEKYPFLALISTNTLTQGFAATALLKQFNWQKIAILYANMDSRVRYCGRVVEDLQNAIQMQGNVVDVVLFALVDLNNDGMLNDTLKQVRQRTRVVVVCLEKPQQRRRYLLKINELGMDGDEYVHILLTMQSSGFGLQNDGETASGSGSARFYEDTLNNNADGKDAIAAEAAKSMLVLDLSSEVADKEYLKYFNRNVINKVHQAPVNCATTACNSTNMSPAIYARQLHDLFYLIGLTVNRSLAINPINGHRNATSLFQSVIGATFDGLTGPVYINPNGTRDPTFTLYGLDSSGQQQMFMKIDVKSYKANITTLYQDAASTIWDSRGGMQPLWKPRCGFFGEDCPEPFMKRNFGYIVAGCVVLSLVIVAFIMMMYYIIRTRQLEQQRLNAEWQIKSFRLQKPPTKKEGGRSKRSLQSGPSTNTESSRYTTKVEYGTYAPMILEKDMVLTESYVGKDFTADECTHFVKLRKLEHESLNKFIGLSLDSVPHQLAVWKMCSRGDLQTIISKGSLSNDPFFIYCIIRDIAEGVEYLHQSFLQHHGDLHSACCLVNDSWQVKISDHGMHFLTKADAKQSKRRLLSIAPEHLREGVPGQSKSGDIYSFAIICSEVITRKSAWKAERSGRIDELLYLIKKGGYQPVRPELEADGIDLNTSLYHLVRDCWDEKPTNRPSAETVCTLLRGVIPANSGNLMDHVFNMMEEYTTTLEQEVEERTKELSEEKKKADVLLQRMLPRQVAERLKLGQTVEPEGFDSVTVFFSDVVKFTQLAAKCSPFQVVSLLNDLYSSFDSIIEEHGVYKVESIGDGYLCVSGLPVRNGSDHVKVIAEMSLDFMKYVKDFRIAHLRSERVDLRIGINSGPCVAGVVGLSMPRYCLFGDTVNTASRMESNGKAAHIHMSTAAHSLLTSKFSRHYRTESRGEVIIKGKGVMETFWLLGRNEGAIITENAAIATQGSVEDETNFEALKSRFGNQPPLNSIHHQETADAGSESGSQEFSEYSETESDVAMYQDYVKHHI